MNPSLLQMGWIILHTQQGPLISLMIYYFGAICLQLQAVESSCYPPHTPHPTLVCSGRLLRTSLKGVFLGHQDPVVYLKNGLLKLLFIPPEKNLSYRRCMLGSIQTCHSLFQELKQI